MSRDFKPSFPASLFLALVVAGCGQDTGRPELGKVHGTVTYKGRPVTSGSVIFTPIAEGGRGETGQVASGPIESDGTYVLTTFDLGDGAILGRHVVTVQSFGDAAKDLGIPRPDGTFAYVLPKLAIPRKYAKANATPLRFTVEPGSNQIDLPMSD